LPFAYQFPEEVFADERDAVADSSFDSAVANVLAKGLQVVGLSLRRAGDPSFAPLPSDKIDQLSGV
jgi:hypothetical protein